MSVASKDMFCWREECHKPFCKEFYDPILELGKGVFDRLKRRFHILCMRSSGWAFCVSGVFVGKEEATHSGDPLTGAIHVIVILARGHGSGNVERQCSNSDVSSGATTGSSLSFGPYLVVSAVALPLLRCACTFAASHTA